MVRKVRARTAESVLEKVLKKVPQLGNSAEITCTPVELEFFSEFPNSSKGAMDELAADPFKAGVTKSADSAVMKAPQPSSVHRKLLLTTRDHSDSVSVVLVSLSITAATCRVTGGDTRNVASRTTPNVPPPPND